MSASQKKERDGKLDIARRLEELSVLNVKLLVLRGQLAAQAIASDARFDYLIGQFDSTQARIAVLEKQTKRKRAVNRRQTREVKY